MLGVEPYVEGSLAQVINCAQYDFECEDLEVSMEALSYCILHIAKMNAITQESFEAIYETMLLKGEFLEPFFGAVRGSIGEMREIM